MKHHPPLLRLAISFVAIAFATGLPMATSQLVNGAEPIVLAGPAMGTTYRVTLATAIPGLTSGEVHRELEAVLARIDQAASTWRQDSEVTRFHRAAPGVWVQVGPDLAAIMAIATEVHAETGGAFDPTVGPLIAVWHDAAQRHQEPTDEAIAAARHSVGLHLIERRKPPQGSAALRKQTAGVLLDLGGIGPGYAVDCLGERLLELGSEHHLVILGGEARAWGTPSPQEQWQVVVPSDTTGEPDAVLSLAPREAVAFSTTRAGRSPIDPRSGRPVTGPSHRVMIRSTTCGRADALAVAAAVDAGMQGQRTSPPPQR